MSDNVYSMLNTAQKRRERRTYQMLPPEEYAKQMQEKRTQAYQMSNDMAEQVANDPKAYLRFLEMLAQLDYTVPNTLLVMAQCPSATVVKDTAHWREQRCYIKKGEKGIAILEPSGTYEGNDGAIHTNYDVKYVFDVSQLGSVPQINQPQNSLEELISGITFECPANLQMMEGLREGVEYSPDHDTIFYSEGLSPDELLSGLAKETCYATVDKEYDGQGRVNDRFYAESANFILCAKLGVPVKDTSFANEVSQQLQGMDARDIKEVFAGIKDIYQTVDERVEKGIYQLQQRNQQRSAPARGTER